MPSRLSPEGGAPDGARAASPGQGLNRRRFLSIGAGAAAVEALPRSAGAQHPRRGGVLKHIGVEPATFDIHASVFHATPLASSLVRRSLFKFVNGARFGTSDFTLAPDLALRAVVSADRRVYTIRLRPGVRWESRPPVNGRELVAGDVKYSLERALRRSPWAGLLGPVQGVETPDKHTVRVHLADTFAPFLHNLAEPSTAILAPEIEDRMGDLKAPESLIGCGPFLLEHYEPGVKAVFARNPAYYEKGRPYLDKVEWLFLKDRPTQLSLFRAGQIDIPCHDAGIPAAAVQSFRKSNPAYPVVVWDRLAVRTLAMRTDKPPFNDVRVRRALSLAVDRKKWANQYPDGLGLEDPGPLSSAMTGWRLATTELGEGARYLEHDPTLARRLLAEAGFPGGLRIRCTSWPGYGAEPARNLAPLVENLKQIGVDLQVVDEAEGQYFGGSLLGRFEETSWGPSSIFTEVDGFLYSFFRSGQPGNRSHVADADLDVLLEAQRRCTAIAPRKRIVDDIQRRAAAQVYYVYTPHARDVAAWAPRVKNYAPKNSLDRGAQLEVVWLDRR